MSWKEVNPMQQKILFIADYLRKISSLTDLCLRYGISRKTGYKWIQRFESTGIDGLNEQTRRPNASPIQTPYRIQQAIIELRQKYQITPGAKKIQVMLAQRYPNITIPSKSTIYNILNRAGLIQTHRRRRRVEPFPQPFSPSRKSMSYVALITKGNSNYATGNGVTL